MFKYIILAIIAIMQFTYLYANAFELNGQIMDENKRPVPGASIRVESTVLGTYADTEGNYNLKNLPTGSFDIIITAVGYKATTQKVQINENSNIDITLEESAITTEPIVVTGTKREKIYQDSPVKVSVLSQKVFNSTASLTLQDGLSFQPGLRIENSCQNCGMSQIRINGMDGQYSQVLIDGKAIFSSLNSVYGLEQIPATMIDRIEVIRGGGSSLYGGNAIAGIVNVITKDPRENSFSASVNQSYTDFSTSNNVVNLSGSFVNEKQNLGAYIFGFNQSRDAFDANNDGFSEISMLDMSTIGGRLFYNPDHMSRIGVEYHYITDERRGGNNFHLPLHESDISEYAAHNIHSAQINYEIFLNTNHKISLYSSVQNTERNTFYGTNDTPEAYGETDNFTSSSGMQYSYIKEGFAGDHIFTLGTEYNTDKIEDIAIAYDRNLNQSVYQTGVYFQDDWSISKKFNLVYGARIDKHNLVDNMIFSPRLNAMYKLFDNMSIRGNISTGFRAPQAFDEDLHIATVGGELQLIQLDDNLKEERSLSYGISADNTFYLFGTAVSTSLEFFHTNLYDAFILEDAGNDVNNNQILIKSNGEEAYVQGLTFETQFLLGRSTTFKTGITYQKSEYNSPVEWSAGDDELNAKYSDKILRTPDFYGYFSASQRISNHLDIFLSGVYTGSMFVPHYAGGMNNSGGINEEDILKATPSFFEFNTKLSYTLDFHSKIVLSLGVNNIFNQYQNDFDIGKERDAGYIYGPIRPRTGYFEISTKI